MDTEYVLGVDPGKNGAFVAIPVSGEGPHLYVEVPCKGTVVDVPKMVADLKALAPKIKYCVMEEVHSIFGASAKSNFQFGWINGAMEAALHAAGIVFVKLQPKMWQKTAWKGVSLVQVPTGKKNKAGETIMKTDTKATALLAARKMYPNETFLASSRSKVPHDGIVDAALIAGVALAMYLKLPGTRE